MRFALLMIRAFELTKFNYIKPASRVVLKLNKVSFQWCTSVTVAVITLGMNQSYLKRYPEVGIDEARSIGKIPH